jgi:hypothetical protein
MSTDIYQNLQLVEIEREIREVRRELAALCSATQRVRSDDSEALPRVLKQLIDMTNELVPGELHVENSVDPDHPETNCVVFRVNAQNKLDDTNAMIDKEIEWHRRARAIFPTATCHFRVAIEQPE